MGKAEQSRDVAINQGILQGDCLSPYASLLYILDSLLRRCEGKGIMMGVISIGNLGYADELDMLGHGSQEGEALQGSQGKGKYRLEWTTCGECGLL